jgi:hypothetical protein
VTIVEPGDDDGGGGPPERARTDYVEVPATSTLPDGQSDIRAWPSISALRHSRLERRKDFPLVTMSACNDRKLSAQITTKPRTANDGSETMSVSRPGGNRQTDPEHTQVHDDAESQRQIGVIIIGARKSRTRDINLVRTNQTTYNLLTMVLSIRTTNLPTILAKVLLLLVHRWPFGIPPSCS